MVNLLTHYHTYLCFVCFLTTFSASKHMEKPVIEQQAHLEQTRAGIY